ncbi:MAG TPA: hypothetical protein VKT29_16195 [Terriglobales bacterium]|nr:hypothetical protein [Terriglobales bacterium]
MAAGYNSHHPYMLRRNCTGLIFGIVVGLLLTLPAAATDWNTPATALAQKIATITGPGAIALETTNRSSLTAAEVNQARSNLIAELQSNGVQVVTSGQAASVLVTFSETATNYLWVAEIRQGAGEDKVVMVSVAGTPAAVTFSSSSPLSIHRTLLWSQDTPILDALLLPGGSPQHLIVLDPEKVSVLSGTNEVWRQEQVFPISHARPWPRDVRGRLVFSQEHLFDAYLPGVVCQAVLAAPLSMGCHEADDPWPLGTISQHVRGFFSPTRNFFTGVLVPGIGSQNAFTPFYAAAPLPRQNYILWALAGVDGAVHMVDGINDVVPKVRWGSDIAALKSDCGSGWQLLATDRDSGENDKLRAYEVADREPAPMGSALEFGGPITALWSKEDGNSAIAVERNSESGKYEAYNLAIACHR